MYITDGTVTLLSAVRKILRAVAYFWIVNWYVDLLCLIDVVLYFTNEQRKRLDCGVFDSFAAHAHFVYDVTDTDC